MAVDHVQAFWDWLMVRKKRKYSRKAVVFLWVFSVFLWGFNFYLFWSYWDYVLEGFLWFKDNYRCCSF